MRKPEELPLLAAGGQTEKERRKKKKNGKEGANNKHVFSTNPSTRFFSKYIQAIHFFHPPFLKFYSRQTQREKEVQDFTVHCRLSTAARPPPTAKCMQPGLGQNSFSALFFFFLFLIFCCSNFSFVVLFKLVFFRRIVLCFDCVFPMVLKPGSDRTVRPG